MSITTMATRPESPKLSFTRPKGAVGKASTLKTRQAHARTAQVVDTNLGSYDRTDPFMAFNVLLKILGSLPSRIGGCQFKLTPEEHKLSLHLLNIVEPFVGLAPSRRTITRQPTEILDSIAFHVDSKRDLMSLALSCQRMHDIVFPRHFQYRHIRCKVSSLSVWNHLMVHRSLARNVRKLEILDERAASTELLIPSDILNSDTDMESTDDELGMHEKQERFLVGALGKMTSLASFTWACNHSPISIDNVWPTLLKCHSLQEVDISDNLAFSDAATAESESSSSSKSRRPIVLPDLKSVAVRSTKHAYGSTKHPVLSRIGAMLTHAPNLETLDIAYAQARNSPGSHPTADELLLYSRFPRLTSLTLSNLRCTIADAPATFLATHTHLTHLRLDLGTSSRLVLPANALPHLRELHCNRDVATAVLSCPSDAPRPLETLKGVRLAGPHTPCPDPTLGSPDQLFLASLRRFGADVRRIELAGWSEMEDIRRLAEAVPNLVWLDIGKKGASRGPPVSNAAEWALLLAGLPELTTFHGVRFFYEVAATASGTSANLTMADRSRVRKNDEVAGVLAWKCTKLRRVDHWEEGGGKVVVLVRDGERERGGEKVRWEVRRVKA
ncbi:hypothetical protein B0H16DRAFT_1625449 [Mycena metata]|uniref:F-box domain-containing protein n=1 Tax=Mycena metata TaxID=1033252 RepID=A0AAD7H5T2_9AGAR|nr:hypothetical protein B0H16DRAFT_1625449 [Mycena metata]